MHFIRGILYRRLKDFTAAIEDLVLAVELSEAGERDPEGDDTQEDLKAVQEDAKAQLVLTYNDFAVHCYSHGHYAEAAMLLTKAIAEQKEERGLDINRGGEAGREEGMFEAGREGGMFEAGREGGMFEGGRYV